MPDDEIAEMAAQNANEEAAPSEGNQEPVELHKVEEEETPKLEAEPVAGEAKEEDPEQPKKEHENGVQRRINELTLKRKEAERKAEDLEKRLQEAEGRKQVAQDNQLAPLIDDFDDHEQYESALVDFKVWEKLKVERQAETVRNQQIKTQQVQRTFNERVKKANLDGFKEASQSLIESKTLPAHLVDVILEHEKGPELVKYLGGHLDVSDGLNNMSQQQALVKLGEITANLSNVKKLKKTTNAPEPVETLSGGGSLNKSIGDMSMEEIDNRK